MKEKIDISFYTDFAVEKTMELLSIDSPSGYTREAAEYVLKEFQAMGFQAELTTKGGVLVSLGGIDRENGILLEAHTDTLGAMVAEIKSNGHLRLTPLGGLNANNVEGENVRIITRLDGVYEGTVQLENPSIHVNGKYDEIGRNFDTVEVVIDEPVKTDKEVKELGIEVGDIVCPDPRSRVTSSGYIKSRFFG